MSKSDPSPALSIIIPAYNCQDQISRMIRSIQANSYTDWELIIVNDKSTDNTRAVVTALAQSDRRIVLINQRRNGGASVARNTGITKASGRYLMFFDADDEIVPTALETFVSSIDNNRVKLAVSGFTVQTFRNERQLSSTNACTSKLPLQQTGESWRIYILRLLGLDGRLYQVWNKIYRADIIHRYHLSFPVGINFGEDLLFNLSYYACLDGSIEFIPQPLYIYRQNLDGGTFSKSSLIYANRQQNFDTLLEFLAAEPDSETKKSLLSWIKYNWIYSHLLALSSSKLSFEQKLASVREIAASDGDTPFSDPTIVGRKRVMVEKLLHFLIHHPSLAIRLVGTTGQIKNSKPFAGAWRALRNHLNS